MTKDKKSEYEYNGYKRFKQFKKRIFCSHQCASRRKRPWRKTGFLLICLNCKKQFYITRARKIKGKNRGKFCCKPCCDKYHKDNKIFKGENNPNWKGGRYIDKRGYVHLNMDGKDCYEHIILMEKFLGRKLKREEEIHHKDKNTSNNKLENLILCKSSSEHRRYDKGWWKQGRKWFKVCKKCNKILEVNKKNFYRRKNKKWVSKCKNCHLNTKSV